MIKFSKSFILTSLKELCLLLIKWLKIVKTAILAQKLLHFFQINNKLTAFFGVKSAEKAFMRSYFKRCLCVYTDKIIEKSKNFSKN